MSLLFGRQRRALTAAEMIAERVGLRTGGATVTQDKALRHSAVWACRRLRADLISTMPVDAYRRVDGVQVEIPKPPVLVNPGGERVGIQEWLYSTQFDLDAYGNTFGLISQRNGAGLPSRIDLIPVEEVTVIGKGETISYRVGSKVHPATEIWHERQFTVSGSAVGLSPMAYAAMSLSGYLSALEFAQQWFSGGATPAAHLKNTAKTLNPSESAAVKERFKASITNGDVFVTGSDWEYSMLGAKAAESGLIDQLKFGVADAARFFGVPGDMIDAEVSSGSITYANVTQRNLQLLIMNIGPAIARREVALSSLLPRPQFVKLNTGALLRMDLKTRYEAHAIATGRRPFMVPSEARDFEDMPPFTPAQLAELALISPAAVTPPTEGAPNAEPTD